MPVINKDIPVYVPQITRYLRERGALFDGKTRFSAEGGIVRRFVDESGKFVASLRQQTLYENNKKYIRSKLTADNGMTKTVTHVTELFEPLSHIRGRITVAPKQVTTIVESTGTDKSILQSLQTDVFLSKNSEGQVKASLNKKHEYLHFKEQGINADGYTVTTTTFDPKTLIKTFEKKSAVAELHKQPDRVTPFFTRNREELSELEKLPTFSVKG